MKNSMEERMNEWNNQNLLAIVVLSLILVRIDYGFFPCFVYLMDCATSLFLCFDSIKVGLSVLFQNIW